MTYTEVNTLLRQLPDSVRGIYRGCREGNR